MTSKTLALSILFLLAGCPSSGGGDGDGTGDPFDGTGPATLSAYCDSYWTSYTTRWAACERGSAAAKAAVFDPGVRCADALQAVAVGRATYDASRAGACLAFIEAASCDVLEAFMQGAYPQADCGAAVAGKLTEFAACYSHESCASGVCGSSPYASPVIPPASCPSSCLTPTPSGAACEFGVPCTAGTGCNVMLPTPVCAPLSALDGRCMNDAWCTPGLYCDTSVAFPYVCKARKTTGSCLEDSECAIGYHCGASSTCVAWLGAGASCTQGQNACGPGLWCGTGGTCVDGPKIGESCDDVNGEDLTCIGGWCNAGAGITCAAWLAPGESCVLPTQCAPTDYCDMADTGKCTTECAEP